jgi:hypothetical protein
MKSGSEKGRRSVVMGLSNRRLPIATVIFILSLLLIYVGMFSVTGSSIRSVTEPVIPVWEPSDEDPAGKRAEDDTPTPTLSPAPTLTPPLEASETANNPSVSEAVETAMREPVAQEPKKPEGAVKKEDPLGGTFTNPADRPANLILPVVESLSPEAPSCENTITFSQDPGLETTDQYDDMPVQPISPQTSPPDSSTGTETLPQPPPELPTDTMPSSDLPADPSLLTEDMANLE